MKQLMIYPCEQDVSEWSCGEYVDYEKIAVWAKEDGRCFIYQLSSRWGLVTTCMSCDSHVILYAGVRQD